MRRYLAAAVLALLAAACGSSSLGADPTPRPEGERGGILDPIDKARGVAEDTSERQQRLDEYPVEGP